MKFAKEALRGACLFALAAATASCAATPQYPLSASAPQGSGGLSPLKPQYAASEAAQAPAAAPPAAAPLSPAPQTVRGVQLAEAQTQAPPRAAARSTDPSPVASAPLAAPPAPGPAPRPAEARDNGKPVAEPPPREVIVAEGETIYDIAAKRRSPVRAIIEANHLSAPYALRAGQRLIVPQPAVYEVAEGDTLFGVSRRFGVDISTLTSLNDLTLQSRLRLGQRVLLPTKARDHGADPRANGQLASAAVAAQVAAAQAPASPPPETGYARPSREEPTRASRARKTPRTAEDAVAAAEKSPTATALGAPLPEDAAAIAAGKGKFVWPVDGQITGRFGVSAAGQKNDGVDIAAPLNTEVQAAADGEVVYAGSTIPAFGNLVLIKHADGWVTAYAHLAKISVKNRASVSQGDTIGLVGDSGSPGVYQLHFEMRYAATPKDKPRPIDPTLLITR